jgi:hypothetical protein
VNEKGNVQVSVASYLAIIACEIEMMQSVVRGRIDELLHLRVGGYDHVRVVDLGNGNY